MHEHWTAHGVLEIGRYATVPMCPNIDPRTVTRARASSIDELDEVFGRLHVPGATEASIARFDARPTDVIITPYGKSGTTWTQQIVHTLRTRGDMDFDPQRETFQTWNSGVS